MKRFLKRIAPYVFYAASALAVFSTVGYAQSKVPINSRLVEKGTSTGIVAGEKLAIYTPKGIDTLITQQGGYINGMVTDVKEINSQTPATTYVQNATYPNPSGNNTTLNFGIKEPQDITCTLYNILGQKIREEKYTDLPAGHHAMQIANIGGLATGVYLTQITGKNFSETRKILHFKSGGGTEPTLSRIIGTGTEENYTKQKLAKTTGTLATTVIDSAIVLESPNVARTKVMDYLSTTDNPINLGTKEVTVKTDANITVQNCDTDTNDAPAKIWINGKEYTSPNGMFNNIRISKDNQYTITAQTFKKNGTPNSFKRTITKTGTINDTLRVVDFYLRDINNAVVDSMDASKSMTPERFKSVMDYLHFHNVYNGRPAPGGNFNHVINGYNTPDRLPKKIVIARNAYFSDTQTTNSFTQGNIDAITQDIQNYITPLIGKNIPIEIKDTVDVVNDAKTGVDYALILPRDIPVYGYGSIIGTQNPPNITLGIVELNSNEPYASDPQYFGFNSGRIQELYTTIFGLNGGVGYDMLNNKESVLIDYIRADTPTKIDFKIVRSVMDKSYSKGTNIDAILGL